MQVMKRNVILLIDADPDTFAATLTAAHSAGFFVRVAQIQRDLSEITQFEIDDVAAIVLDYDPDVHGSAIAEQLRQCPPPRPLILISSEESFERPLIFERPTSGHLTKPVTVLQLAHAIEKVLHHELDCDRRGYPTDSGRLAAICA